jgi:hypothetical protein
MKKNLFLFAIAILGMGHIVNAQNDANWSYDLGISFFKTSLRHQPDELLYNPVFEKWEYINRLTEEYSVTEYMALSPFQFNLSLGIDGLFRFKRYFMIKVGYNYTNTLGVGGTGNIAYTNRSSGLEVNESKEMSYSSHQINYFIGPVLPVGAKGAEIFMGFSLMSPTYVTFSEKYRRSEAESVVREYDIKVTGFFGNCRSVIGIQVPVSDKLRLGTEMVYSYFNGLELKSGQIADQGFSFPDMQWNFTLRYNLK